ncbi:type I polyketide synthase [Lentzea sp. NPDC051208]|uniref:type I polyketide synthase n=1 Tax=Lentzea sp. NPDC051208 TaxID=3154642 RepID=UPI003415C4F4
MTRIAIVGVACRYPDAVSAEELWENALAGRRAFRRLPDERMRLEDYWDPDPSTPDRFYARTAAVIEGYEFDRVAHRIAGSTYRSTDLTHWLALDTAGRALSDAGFAGGEGLPRERTGVVVGNTLTGEFARANLMRLRWPYVRRTVAASLKARGWADSELEGFLADLEATYKSPFPAIDEDSLAGGLANTIAGRVCNYFGLNGGGYTVDGACSSSLLSVATAAGRLVDGDLDVVVAGGVDLSIDPFEIVGFAKTGALARSEMRVYDRGSNGFWPGEGCGMVVLMREQDVQPHQRVYATVAGWGVSSDGWGGMTRPEVSGYRLALARAYERAGFGVDTVPLFEGHGTGTEVGDATELRALSQARADADPAASPAAISTIKGMIGHTKAAAGVAGLIKAALALHHQTLPPTIGCVDPHPVLTEDAATLRVLRNAEPWPAGAPLRAGITAMGFGGINTHVVLESSAPLRAPDTRALEISAAAQDAEVLLVDAESAESLRARLTELAEFAARVSYAELGDLAATLHTELADRPYRAAVVARSPEDAVRGLDRVLEAAASGAVTWFAPDGRGFLGHVTEPATVGFLFPGQGSGQGTSGGAMRRRFAAAREVYERAALPTSGDMVATSVAQPRIVTGSLAGLRVLAGLGVTADVAVGHSLGEITALHWAGAIDERTLLRVASVRGATMAEHSASGTMASLGASAEEVSELVRELPVVIAAFNGPKQTVVAGTDAGVAAAVEAAAREGVRGTALRVSHAFHSPLVAPAADALHAKLAAETFTEISGHVVSTVTGETLAADTDIRELLRAQITDPVLFSQAIGVAAKDADLLVEVGPGRVLTTLAADVGQVPVVALDTDDESLVSLLGVVGAAHVTGAALNPAALFADRLVRPLRVGQEFSFFASPCEQAPELSVGAGNLVVTAVAGMTVVGTATSTVDVLREMAAARAELPSEAVAPESRLLDDLHLSSITVGQLVNEAAQRLGVPPASAPTNFATATVRELADALDDLNATARETDTAAAVVTGAGPWARAFVVEDDPVPLRPVAAHEDNGQWQLYAEDSHPFAERLRRDLERGAAGDGVLVCLPEVCEERHLELALRGAKSAAARGDGRFVLVQHDAGAAAMAKTLRLEAPGVRVTVVHLPAGASSDVVLPEVLATTAFSEVRYDRQMTRTVPTMRALPVSPSAEIPPLTDTDVLLITGGGKGITAECALSLAQEWGVRLAVLGRSEPSADAELAANLDRMRARGIEVAYAVADVTDAERMRAAVGELEAVLGPVTAVLHGAGRNEPAALSTVDADRLRSTMAPKIDGLRAVLGAVDAGSLRLLVTFGSIIGRSGLRGEAHYGTANDWLAALTREFADGHPSCRALCLEWSVWSGVGMGERLAVVESLSRDGVAPIPPDEGVRILRRLLVDPETPEVVVVSGRTEGVDTVRHDLPPLPLLRFVDKPLVRYHGVELVTEVELNAGTDLYLADHLLDGNLLFPAVYGMEAMTQVAAAVTGHESTPVLSGIRFLRPIVVPPRGSTTIRIAAVVTADDVVDVAIRSSETAFETDHFVARLSYGKTPPLGEIVPDAGLPPVALDPATQLYGDTMFQGARFQRLRRFHEARARDVDADVAVSAHPDGFAGYLPAELLLADPGMRDALMHGNQVCVPDGTLLPERIDRLYPVGAGIGASEVRMRATERHRDGDTYVYDIAVFDGDEVVERWEGLHLRAVRRKGSAGPWVAPLLGSHLEREVEPLLGHRVAVVVEPDREPGTDRATRRRSTALAVSRLLGRETEVRYRSDGRPEVDGGLIVSASHAAGVTLCVAADRATACDLQDVAEQEDQVWQGLLGRRHRTAALLAEAGEPFAVAATRVWSAVECLQKAGLSLDTPLTPEPGGPQGWRVFTAPGLRIATLVTSLRGVASPVVAAVLMVEGS